MFLRTSQSFSLYLGGCGGRRNKRIFENESLRPNSIIGNILSNQAFFVDYFRSLPHETRRVGC